MKKLIAVILFLSSSFFLTPLALAQNNLNSTNEVILPKDQTIQGDYFASGNNVTISGTINGDTYIAGGNVLIEGTINGDLLTIGGNINITGNVTNNIRALGGQIILSGPVGRNITLAGGNATITNSSKIDGSLVATAGMLSIQAPINKNINFAVVNAVLANTINGNINAAVGNLTITPNATINGDLNYWSNKQVNVQPGATISGQIKQNIPPKTPTDGKNIAATLIWMKFIFSLVMILSYLLGGLLLIKFFPIYAENIINTMHEKFLLSFLTGLVIIILLPILFILMLVTFIGIPFAFLLLAFFCILAFFAPIVFSLFIGRKILARTSKNKTSLGWSLVLGLVIYFIINLIPVIGSLITGIATLFGIGTIFLQQKNLYHRLRSQKMI